MCYIQYCFFPSGGDDVFMRLSLIKQINQGCQFDVYFIQCQTSTDILGIVNEFIQYIQNYFQYLYITI